MGRGRRGGNPFGGSGGSRPCKNGSYACKGSNKCLRCSEERRAEQRSDREEHDWRYGGAVNGEAAKVNQEGDRVEALWGGEGSPDGDGHGHIVTNDGTNAAYMRYPGEVEPVYDDRGDRRRRRD